MYISRTDLLGAILFAQDNREKEYSMLLDIFRQGSKNDSREFRVEFYISNDELVQYVLKHS